MKKLFLLLSVLSIFLLSNGCSEKETESYVLYEYYSMKEVAKLTENSQMLKTRSSNLTDLIPPVDYLNKIKSMGCIVNGAKDGAWDFYDINGKVIKTQYYFEGKLVKDINEYNKLNNKKYSRPGMMYIMIDGTEVLKNSK